ncbi:hypothetical protein MMC27_000585 [Xylographa pallens]|nr:hypothetical protein [Xylographa pallens]
MAVPTVTQKVGVFDEGLSILYEPADRDASVDIIFVHGLQGHPQRTWSYTEQKDRGGSFRPYSLLPSFLQGSVSETRDSDREDNKDVFWPIDLLSTECPNARIMTWGYDSHVSHFFGGPANQTNLSGHAKDLLYGLDRKRDVGHKIIFVAHSLGGIIVKEVLRRSASDEEERLRDIASSTHAIIFLGTPHRGSGYASLGNIVQNIVAIVGFDTNDKHIEALKFDGSELERSREEFTKQWRKAGFQVRTFQESLGIKGVRGLNEKVVPDMSSSLDDPRERAQHINKNHMDMCKFFGFEDPGYQRVGGEIKTFVKELEERLRQHSEKEVRQRQEFAQTKSITDEEKECLQSLYFTEMDARHQNIKQPLSETCGWLFRHRDYQDWYTKGSGLLWLKGKAGSGKSSLVKRAVQEMENDVQKGNTLIAKYFFNARGTLLEKSYTGLVRSMVHQILTQSRPLLTELLVVYRKKKDIQGHKVNWHVEELRSFLLSALQSQTQSISLFIDALDECADHERQDVVSFLEQLTNFGRSTQLSIGILFSSRQFPDIYIEECNEIEPEKWNRADISEYVHQKLLKIAAKQGVSELQQEIVGKSQGVFLWVVLVVDILIKNRHETITEKRKKLQQVPSELDQLFTSILKEFDAEELQKTAKIVQWVLFAERPLSPEELFTAIAFDTEHPYTSFEAWRTSGEFWEDENQLEAWIRTRSRGLAEVKRYQPEDFDQGDYQERSIVQFIHESVRTFFLHGNRTILELLYPSMSESFVGCSHTQLARACINILSIDEILLWASEALASLEDSTYYATYYKVVNNLVVPSISSSFQDYAVLFLFEHARYLGIEDLQQANIVDMLVDQEAVFQAWALLHDKMKPSVHRHGPQANLLYTTSYYNLPSHVCTLLRNHSEQYDSNRTSGGLYKFPLIAAAARDNIEVVKLLLKNGACIEARDRYSRTALHISARHNKQALTQVLLDGGADIEAQNSILNTPLHIANAEIIQLLLDRGATIEVRNSQFQTPLHSAVIARSEQKIRLLLNQGADIEARDNRQNTPLHTTILGLREDIARLLIDRGANTEALAQNDKGDTSLDIAIKKDRELMGDDWHSAVQSLVCSLHEYSRRRSDTIL